MIKRVSIVALLFLLAACDTQSELKTLQTKTGNIEPSSVVALDVPVSGDLNQSFYYSDSRQTKYAALTASTVKGRLRNKLVSRGTFSTVRPKDAPEAQYDMTVVISYVDKVDPAARLLLGNSAFGLLLGGDELTATVTVKDRATGKVINQFKINTEAAAWFKSSNYGMDSGISQLTDMIVEKL